MRRGCRGDDRGKGMGSAGNCRRGEGESAASGRTGRGASVEMMWKAYSRGGGGRKRRSADRWQIRKRRKSRGDGAGNRREFRRFSGVGKQMELQEAAVEWGLSRIRNFVSDRDGNDDGKGKNQVGWKIRGGSGW